MFDFKTQVVSVFEFNQQFQCLDDLIVKLYIYCIFSRFFIQDLVNFYTKFHQNCFFEDPKV